MAFFKFRLPHQNSGDVTGNTSNPPAESADALRRRARHRLIGASVLVVVGVVGFPLLFDTQPRPVSTDIAVDIPDRSKANVSKTSKSISGEPKNAPLDAGAALDPKEEVITSKSDVSAGSSKPESKADSKADPKPEPKVDAKVEPKTEVKAEAKSDSKADDVSNNKDATQRFVVQVGSFAEEVKSREVRTKLEKAGYKTYTHVAETKEGKRTRVRVGPFATRDEADKVASKIKQMQLQPQVLSL